MEQVRKAQDYLDGWPAEPVSPMRYQHDNDISAGYMHSGYPIMTFMDVVNDTLDIPTNHWGQFHEVNCCHGTDLQPCNGAESVSAACVSAHFSALRVQPPAIVQMGHNHQNGSWTWSCTIEVR